MIFSNYTHPLNVYVNCIYYIELRIKDTACTVNLPQMVTDLKNATHSLLIYSSSNDLYSFHCVSCFPFSFLNRKFNTRISSHNQNLADLFALHEFRDAKWEAHQWFCEKFFFVKHSLEYIAKFYVVKSCWFTFSSRVRNENWN